MQNKKTEILTYLVELYKDFYSHKDLFKINFKYSLDEVEEYCNKVTVLSKTDNTAKSSKEESISDKIRALATVDDIKAYFSTVNQSKEDIIQKTSLAEFAYLYNIVYSSPLKPNMRKIDAFNAIEKYFYGISRAVSMKP
ncbi:hypothetical protein FACS189494_06550 [Spirochaetia bacterium]|nr:hypothetical protein FACS189494_06550 [Spirochaetia bacterium]